MQFKQSGYWSLLVKKVSNISQGSVLTHLRCGGISNHEFITNLPLSLTAKELRKLSASGKVMGDSKVAPYLTHTGQRPFSYHTIEMIL